MFKEGFACSVFLPVLLHFSCSKPQSPMLKAKMSYAYPCSKTAKAPSRLTTRRGFADFKKGEEFLIKYYPRFLSTNAAAASTSIAGAMLIAGAPVFGFFSPLLSPLEAII